MLKFCQIFLLAVSGFCLPAGAQDFSTITDKSTFVGLVSGKDLTRLGIRLNVLENGAITGKAFGRKVTGDWQWDNGFFCRDLYYGKTDLGPNCQMVKLKGQTMRFITDRGAGIYADLALE